MHLMNVNSNTMHFQCMVTLLQDYARWIIAMPKGLYFTAVIFLSFFLLFWRLISQVSERISTKLEHIFTYDCYLKKLVRNFPGIHPPTSWGAKTAFLGPTLNFYWTYRYICSIGYCLNDIILTIILDHGAIHDRTLLANTDRRHFIYRMILKICTSLTLILLFFYCTWLRLDDL